MSDRPLSERVRDRLTGTWIGPTRPQKWALLEEVSAWADEIAALEQELTDWKRVANDRIDERNRLREMVFKHHEIIFTYYGGCNCDDCKSHRVTL